MSLGQGLFLQVRQMYCLKLYSLLALSRKEDRDGRYTIINVIMINRSVFDAPVFSPVT